MRSVLTESPRVAARRPQGPRDTGTTRGHPAHTTGFGRMPSPFLVEEGHPPARQRSRICRTHRSPSLFGPTPRAVVSTKARSGGPPDSPPVITQDSSSSLRLVSGPRRGSALMKRIATSTYGADRRLRGRRLTRPRCRARCAAGLGAASPGPLPREDPLRPLRQDLEHMLGCLGHHVEDLVDEGDGHLLVEEVAHAVDEDSARAPPPERQRQSLGMEGDLREGPASKALGQPLGVAELAAWRHLGAPGDWIPRRVRPFDRGVERHRRPTCTS
jgi:hypothetical protein